MSNAVLSNKVVRREMLRITRCPAFMGTLLSICNFHKMPLAKGMFSTKGLNTSDRVFSPIWTSEDQGFHLATVSFSEFITCLLAYLMSKIGSARFLNGLRGAFLSKAISVTKSCLSKMLTMFRRKDSPLIVSIAKFTESQPLTAFWRRFIARFPKFSCAYSSTSCRRTFPAKLRACYLQNIEKRVELIHPVLLSRSQKFRSQYQFQNLKGERIGAVLIPSVLQSGVSMSIILKITKMVSSALVKVHRATNVGFLLGGFEGNAINSWGTRNGFVVKCVHSYVDLLNRFASLEAALYYQYKAVSSCFNMAIISQNGLTSKVVA